MRESEHLQGEREESKEKITRTGGRVGLDAELLLVVGHGWRV
jgi:hypothetical protein